MAELTSCPECGRKLRVPENLLGQSVKCPSCTAVFTAAADAPAAPTPAAPPPLPAERDADEESVSRRRRRPRDDDDEPPDDDYDRPRRRRRRPDQEPHRGGMILTFGILAFVICGPIFGPIAWIMGQGDLRKIREGRMDPEGHGLTMAGMILGIISTCLTLLACGIYGLIFIVAGAGGFK